MSEARQYVVGFLFCGAEVLLIEKARPEWQRGRLNGVGGHVEPGESFLDAMRREFAEETGWAYQPWEHFVTLTGDDRDTHRQGLYAGSTFEVAFFRAEWTDGRRETVPQMVATDEALRWAAVASLPETVLPNLRWLVPLAFHAYRPDWPLFVTERAVAAGAGDRHFMLFTERSLS